MKIGNLEEYIDLEELPEEIYSVKDSVDAAKAILQRINSESENVNVNFEDDIWAFEDHLAKGHKILIKFTDFRYLFNFSKSVNSAFIDVDMIKCWTCLLLDGSYASSVSSKVNLLITVINKTNIFEPEKLNDFLDLLRDYSEQDKFLDELEKKQLKKEKVKGLKTVYAIINSAVHFINFIDSEHFHVYHKELLEIRNALPQYKAVPRILPKGKDILKFDYCIEEYFKDGLSTPSRLYYAPILLWWKITTIIPMRISEFCNIKRNATSYVNGAYYITLPRKKQEYNKRRIQVINTLEISEDIYELVEIYKDLTNDFGESETLISWVAKNKLAVEHLKVENYFKRSEIQVEHKYFNKENFKSLLKSFYSNVVFNEFNLSVERTVRPNDTRHFAFCSLMMQGITSVEIARLGGHSTLEAQYHYSNHTEYFIDVEVKKLVDGFKRENDQLTGTTLKGHEFTMKDVEKKSYKFPPKDNVRLPLSIGYCTDSMQRCQSEECMLCDYWWIHPNEINKYKPLINDKIRERKQKIIEISNFLKKINESFTTAMVIENGIRNDELNKLDTESAAIREELIAIAKFEMIKGYDEFDE